MKHLATLFWLGCLMLCSSALLAQNPIGLKLVEKLLDDNRFEEAETELNRQIRFFKQKQNLDTLTAFPYLLGKVLLGKKTLNSAISQSEAFIDDLKDMGASPRQLQRAYMNVVPFLDEVGKPQRSYELTVLALDYAHKMPDKTNREIGFIEYNLGASQLTLGNFDLAKTHFRKALQLYQSHPNMPPQKLSDAYNAMGAMMWLSSKLDSAAIYYSQAVAALDEMEDDPVNKAYLSAIVQANIGLINLTQGNASEAIQYTRKAIDNYQITLNGSDDLGIKAKARKYQWRSISNLATIYNELGDFQTTHQLLTYVYDQHQKNLQPTDPTIYKSKVTLSQSLLNLKEYEEALSLLTDALDQMRNAPGDHLYWQAVTLFTLAKTYDHLDRPTEADKAYEESEQLFEQTLAGEYDREFLGFLNYKSSFYAKEGKTKKALNTANKGVRLSEKIGGPNSVLAFKHAVNAADVNYLLGNYESALDWSERSIEKLTAVGSGSGVLADSIIMEFQKPNAMLIQAKSRYALQPEKDSAFLSNLLTDLEKAIPILERRKSGTGTAENLNLLIADNTQLFDFLKKITLDLYQQTGEEHYLERLLSLHESGLYNRIRTRLNARKATFAGVPETVLAEEAAIRKQLKEALSVDSNLDNAAQLDSYFSASRDWESYLQKVKKNYPKYHKMRFEEVLVPLGNIQDAIQEDVSVVRYLFVDEQLFALVLTQQEQSLFMLDYQPVNTHIEQFTVNRTNLEQNVSLLRELYDQIWAPFAEKITTDKVVIIPDGYLFNLSFELLLPEQVTDYAGFAKKSLLAKHAISYNYSLLLLKEESEVGLFQDDYVVFAPGFSDDLKNAYSVLQPDSLNRDMAYLQLLPQPFTSELAKAMKKQFRGKAFLAAHSTEASFKENADLHRIIHIGTHAESDNISPGMSRLIFAKPPEDSTGTEDNYLYTYEVYNCDLNANLTLLTACETGKPGYQPGEGMISMAHAFNYAGSESILTGLWKIDEESSTIITRNFFQNLADGMDKDVALQQAKLTYVREAKGRTAAPDYWAGLVLLGKTDPVALSRPSSAKYLLLLLLIFPAFMWWRRSQTVKTS